MEGSEPREFQDFEGMEREGRLFSVPESFWGGIIGNEHLEIFNFRLTL